MIHHSRRIISVDFPPHRSRGRKPRLPRSARQLVPRREGRLRRSSLRPVHSDAAGAIAVFHYDITGNLIAETDAAGALLREYVRDDDGRPLAQIAAGVVTYLHPDHLGTPRIGTDAGRAVVWQWASDAFGTTSPTGAVTVNLRYPGQYFDAETGLHYNWHRTYDPASGRYLESDPVGISLASSRPYSEGSVAIARTKIGRAHV